MNPLDVDQQLPQHIRSARAEQGVTSATVTKLMRDLGFTWHPTTQSRVESGTRRITVGEAMGLSQILGVNLLGTEQNCTTPTGVLEEIRVLAESIRELVR